MASTDLQSRVDRHERALFGDPDNPDDRPGLIHQFRTMSTEQQRTNTLLEEIRGGIRKIVWVVIIALLGAALSFLLRTPRELERFRGSWGDTASEQR